MSELEPARRQTILVVDDTPDNLSMISGLLKDAYRVKVATNGERALAIAAGDPKPDLILLDIMMPEIDGFEVCRRLKLSEDTRTIPVVFLSAKTEEAERKRGLEVGAIGYLCKPVDPRELLAEVSSHLA
jgi:putative two-component system response regulator